MQKTIIQNCIKNKEYVRKVLPYLKAGYFDGQDEKIIFSLIKKHIIKYKALPKISELKVELQSVPKISGPLLEECTVSLDKLDVSTIDQSFEWLVDSTEKWIRKQALTKAILNSADLILDKKDNQEKINTIPSMIQDALKIQFDTDIGIEFLDTDDIAGRWQKYHEKILKFSTGITALDELFNGGVEPKAVTLMMAGCIDENTLVRIKIGIRGTPRLVKIKNIEQYLENDVILIDTPDGYQEVTEIVKKGYHIGYEASVKDKKIIVTGNHLFDTKRGWIFAKDVQGGDVVLYQDGNYYPIKVRKTDAEYNIYDLVVNHPNHRYYADGISSHNTNAGKTNAKIAICSNFLREGHDVLYITLEMSEEKIAQRFDANFLQIPINDVGELDEDYYIQELTKIKQKTLGRLIIKNYPPASINALHIRALLDELELKKGFKPKIIAVDYINLMLSSRYKAENLYTTMKSILEEVRAIAVEYDISILTSTQGNRETNSTTVSDIDLTNISESYGVGSGADAIIALIFPDELRKQNLQRWKILKSRYGDKINVSFMVGIDFKTASVFDVNDQDFRLIDKVPGTVKKLNKKNVSVIVEEEDLDTLFAD